MNSAARGESIEGVWGTSCKARSIGIGRENDSKGCKPWGFDSICSWVVVSSDDDLGKSFSRNGRGRGVARFIGLGLELLDGGELGLLNGAFDGVEVVEAVGIE